MEGNGLVGPELITAIVAILAVTGLALILTRPARRRPAEPVARRYEPVDDDEGAAAATSQAAADARSSVTLFDAASADSPTVTFADVAGLDDAIAELREVKEYLADPARFAAVGAELPRGILLCGHPGNGKTLLARALAGEAGVPFYPLSATGFVEQYVGLGAARIRSAFEEVRNGPLPAIVFLDELDAVGSKRSGGQAGEREFDHTLNQLLVELDGFTGASGVLILGATNRPELLDPALVRPGRFDRKIQIERPDLAGRAAILRLHAAPRPFSRQVDWEAVAGQTTGLTGADLAGIVNEACLLAARGKRDRVSAKEVQEAVSRGSGGARSSRLIGEDEKFLIGYHEAGHAVLSLLLKGVTIPARVSIVARADPLAGSAWSFGDDRETRTKRELMAQLIVLLGGRAAEMNAFGEPSTRAEDDLDDAAKLARRMVERWAMTGQFELAGRDHDPVTRSRTENRSEPAVAKMLAQAEQAARTILADHANSLAAVAETLVVWESLLIGDVASVAGLAPPRPVLEHRPAEALASVSRLHG
ncbi:hypothetical protein BH20ACT2_BH20ACT2_01250 [soil metagenome]